MDMNDFKHRLPAKLAAITMIIALVGLSIFSGCQKSSEQKQKAETTTIQVKGSDTMVNVAQAWAEEYKNVEPSVDLEVSGGGSGVGIAALTRSAVDIATASRDMKADEMETARRNTGKEVHGFIVGFDAVAVYVNKNNPLDEITIEQLASIFAEDGATTKWSQLGVTIPEVSDDNIVRVSRQSSSGTYEFFREHVLQNKDFKLGSRDMNGSKEVVELIGNTKTAIGYSGMGYTMPSVKMLKIAQKAGDTAWPPTVENTMNKNYPLARSLHIYTLGEPQGAVKKYIEWMLSESGQKILEDNGYVPNFSTSKSE